MNSVSYLEGWSISMARPRRFTIIKIVSIPDYYNLPWCNITWSNTDYRLNVNRVLSTVLQICNMKPYCIVVVFITGIYVTNANIITIVHYHIRTIKICKHFTSLTQFDLEIWLAGSNMKSPWLSCKCVTLMTIRGHRHRCPRIKEQIQKTHGK